MELNIVKTELNLGLEKEVRLLHVTDSHICRAYDTEDADLCAMAKSRKAFFDGGIEGKTERLYEQACKYAKENGLTMVHTGDLIDFISEANLDYIEHAFDGIDCLYASGNHDFCHYVGRAKEDLLYKRENMKKIAPRIKDNMIFSSKDVGGVNLVALDDSYYRITDGQIDMLRAEAAKGMPILLFMHVPFYVPEYAEFFLKNNGCSYMLNTPREILERFSENRFFAMAPDEQTIRAVDYIMNEPAIKAFFVGHNHENGEEMLSNGVMQYITGATYKGYVREIIIR